MSVEFGVVLHLVLPPSSPRLVTIIHPPLLFVNLKQIAIVLNSKSHAGMKNQPTNQTPPPKKKSQNLTLTWCPRLISIL